MDRNTIIGIVLIAVIIIGYSLYTMPSEEELAKAREEAKRRRDSMEMVEKQKLIEEEKARAKKEEQDQLSENDTLELDTTNVNAVEQKQKKDSLRAQKLVNLYGSFAPSASGKQKIITLENELIKLKVSTKGARPYSVALKKYYRYDSTQVVLFEGDKSAFNFSFFAQNRTISTDSLFFRTESPEQLQVDNGKTELRLRAYTDSLQDKYLEVVYSLEPNSYLVDYQINFVNLNDVISTNTSFIDLNWYAKLPGLEKGRQWENDNSTIYYKFYQDEVDYLSERSDTKDEKISVDVKWIAFKQQFFSSILIADTYFTGADLKYVKVADDKSKYLKECYANIAVPYNGSANEQIPFTFYFGPNKHKTLTTISDNAETDLHLQEIIPLGWAIFRWVNRFAIIPLFNFLGSFIQNMGLIILIMTIVIKMVLFPLTYKSYLSSARMRVLKPQIDEINKKIPSDKAMERQQATMALYRKAGVNPMGGCLPMLLQFPILIAMYRFFPSSIELRQESFLWADDLSTYDSILDLPFEIPFYGDHISLFCLLMAASMILTTRINSTQMSGAGSQMAGMKVMMYIMPVMMLVWFNNYSSGLSYYYLLANLITFVQTIIMRRFVDDEAILKKLQSKKKKPAKKSGFQKRLEEMAKQKGYKLPK